MNGMKKKNTYLVLVFALFVVEDIYHAWGVDEKEELITPKANYYVPTLSRKLLAFGGYNNISSSDLVPDPNPRSDLVSGIDPSFNFGSGSDMGSSSSMGSNTDLVPDAKPGADMVSGSNPSFNFGSGSNMGSDSSTDLVPDANPGTGIVSGSDPSFNFGSGSNMGSDSGTGSTFRIGPGGPGCSKEDIEVDQGATGPLPSGIPTYTVIITNTCTIGSCTYSNIHLTCGWFSSFNLIDPNVFRRIAYNDCLLKNGATLNPNEVISFVYADTFPYPLAVSSVTC